MKGDLKMQLNKSKYFIAILPPQEVSERVQQIKESLREKYNTVAALKSPAHITLQPPYTIDECEESHYILKLQSFSFSQGAFEIFLKNFAAFPPRTLYIDVAFNQSLSELQRELREFLMKESLIRSNQIDNRPYNAHVTVANRDLTPDNFKTAWETYQNESFSAKFEVSGFSLLKHNGATWDVVHSFKF